MPAEPDEPPERPLEGLAKRFHILDQVFRTVRAFGLFSLIAFGLDQARLALQAFAGQSTSVHFETILRAFVDVRVAAAFSLAGGAASWAVVERVLRRRAIRRLHGRVKELELKINPSRPSSGLTVAGKTNPDDREL